MGGARGWEGVRAWRRGGRRECWGKCAAVGEDDSFEVTTDFGDLVESQELHH